MRVVPLGEVARVVSGGTPKTSVAEYWDGDIPWATPTDLSRLNGPQIIDTARTITAAGLASSGATVLPAGSVLLSSRAPIGYVAMNAVPMATNQGFKSLVPGPELDAGFLYHWLRSKTSYLRALGNGATFAEISKRTAERILVPLPPTKEQHRIAAILDAADAIRSKRKAVLDHLDSLSDALFHQAFGDPLSSRAATPSRPLGSVAQVLTGNSPSRQDPKNFGNDIEWIKSGNLGGRIATRAEEGLSEVGRRRARIAPKGSVLVTCIAGSPTSIGKASIVDRDVAFNQQINAVLPSANLHPEFLLAQLRVAPALVRQKSTGGMKGLVSKSAFETIEILVPAIEAQDAFVRRKGIVDAARAAVQRALAADDELFASLQSRAFSGKL